MFFTFLGNRWATDFGQLSTKIINRSNIGNGFLVLEQLIQIPDWI